MHLDNVFGNVSTNTRLLERSLAAALNNRHRRMPVGASAVAREVESLLGHAHSLDLTSDGASTMGVVSSSLVSNTYAMKNEHAALRHMLETSVIVSMMAEEFRVFVAGAPASRCGNGGNGRSGGTRANKQPSQRGNDSGRIAAATTSTRSTMFRRPIFFTFKPTSHAVANIP